MTALTFPSNPIEGQIYNAPNGIQYVFDGVKWSVENVASSSEAVTNSVQDRVAPMLVDGDHQGISFTYNAETNTLSANITSTVGNKLVNGLKEFTLESDGTLSLPANGFIKDSTGAIVSLGYNNGKLTVGSNVVRTPIQITMGGLLLPTYTWTFDEGGVMRLPEGGDIVDSNNNSVLSNPISGAIAQGAYELSINTDGNLQYPGAITQSFQRGTACLPSVDTVVYTSTGQYQHGIRLFIMVEGMTDGGGVNWDTQACDVIAVKGYNDNIVHVTTYGVTYSGATAIATFDGQWNATTSRIEITCRPISVTNGVTVSVHALEINSVD